MNILIIFMLGLNLILLPLVAYLTVRTLSSKLDTNARWHRQALNTEIDTLLLKHEGRLVERIHPPNNAGTINNTGTFSNQSGVPFDNAGKFNNAGALNNSGALNTSGSLINTGTIINDGSITNAGAVAIALGATLSNPGTFIQSAGSTKVDGLFSSSTTIQINGGTLSGSGTIQGDVTMGGTLSPGDSPGVLTITGNYTQFGNGTFTAELTGRMLGTQYDQLIVGGTATLDGTLDVNLLNDFAVKVGDHYVLMTFASESGQFSTLDLPKSVGGEKWVLSYNPTEITLSVEAVPTPEPSGLLMLGSGLLGIAWTLRRKINL